MSDDTPVIEAQQVRKVFARPDGGEIEAVAGISFSVPRGETLCLLGTSGCGKTTTMRMINRLEEPTGGRILVEGKDVAKTDPIALRRSIGYVIQRGGLFPHMTVARNVGLLCEIEGWDRDRIRARVDELLSLVNLEPDEFRERHPAELSGGQRQRVGVARALALDPAIVLMDEPFGALDPITRASIHAEFSSLQEKVAKSIILVTHDLAEAFALGDRIALMDAGRILQIGTQADLLERPATEFVTRFVEGHLADA